MANLATSAVSLYGTLPMSTRSQLHARQEQLNYRRLKLVLTGQGSATNTIPAGVLGFQTLLNCSGLWDATNSKGYPAVIDPVNNIILLLDGSAAPAPVDVTSSAAYITVLGELAITPSLTGAAISNA